MTTRAQRAAVASFDPAVAFDNDKVAVGFFSETDWNYHVRYALQRQRFRAFHIREASENGVADIVVYHNKGPHIADGDQVIDAWLELKVVRLGETWESKVRPAQREFMRDHWRLARNALLVIVDRKVDMISVRQGDLKGRVKMYKPNPYAINWQEVFDHFKARKVSL